MRDRDGEPDVDKSMDWVNCPKHGISYPLGESCPQCEAEMES